MKYRPYLSGCADVSEIGVGGWQLSDSAVWSSMSDAEATSLVHHALDLGINFFDTAPNYGLGTSEQRLGSALKGVDRDRFIINTKFGHNAEDEFDFESSSLRDSVEGSLRRLGVGTIDSLLLHNPPAEYLDGNRTDHYEILDTLVAEGKIKGYGASLDTYDDMKLLMDTTGSKVIEACFNILFQDSARAFEQAQTQGIAIIAKIPLDSGWLSGKYSADSQFDDIRSRWSAEDKRTRERLVQGVRERLPADMPMSQAAIAFCLAHDAVTTVIPGNKNLDQLEDNITSTRLSLPQATLDDLHRFYEDEVRPLGIPW